MHIQSSVRRHHEKFLEPLNHGGLIFPDDSIFFGDQISHLSGDPAAMVPFDRVHVDLENVGVFLETPDTLTLITRDENLAVASVEEWRDKEYTEKWLAE